VRWGRKTEYGERRAVRGRGDIQRYGIWRKIAGGRKGSDKMKRSRLYRGHRLENQIQSFFKNCIDALVGHIRALEGRGPSCFLAHRSSRVQRNELIPRILGSEIIDKKRQTFFAEFGLRSCDEKWSLWAKLSNFREPFLPYVVKGSRIGDRIQK
jgi:hypothetical protein